MRNQSQSVVTKTFSGWIFVLFFTQEIYKLLENDQFPRFRRSPLYLGFLEELLPRSYAERWTTSFDALLGNQVIGEGRKKSCWEMNNQ